MLYEFGCQLKGLDFKDVSQVVKFRDIDYRVTV